MASNMEPQAKTPARDEKLGPLWGARVLIVEDDFFIAMELESIFSDAGGEVVGLCRTVKDALVSAKAEDLAVAILDFQMGEETTVGVAQILAGRQVPFAFYTGHAEIEPLCTNWPECKVVSKPARPQALVNAVADLLRENRAGA